MALHITSQFPKNEIVSRKDEKARRRRERRARKHLEIDKATITLSENKTYVAAENAKQTQTNSLPVSIDSPNPLRTNPSHSQETNTLKKPDDAKYVVRPVVSIWGRLVAFGRLLMHRTKTLGWLTRPFRLFDRHNGSVQAFATLAIVVLTYVYVQYSKKQWQVAQDTLTVSQRAYVTIGTKDGVVARFVPSQDAKQNAELVLYFQNSGHIPAKIAWGTSGPAFIAGIPGTNQSSGIVYGPPFKGMPVRTRNKKTGVISEHAEGGQLTCPPKFSPAKS